MRNVAGRLAMIDMYFWRLILKVDARIALDDAQQSLAADGARAFFSSDLFPLGRMLFARRS
jgi:hypothetical protein